MQVSNHLKKKFQQKESNVKAQTRKRKLTTVLKVAKIAQSKNKTTFL